MAPLTAFRNCKFFALIFAVFMHLSPMCPFNIFCFIAKMLNFRFTLDGMPSGIPELGVVGCIWNF